VGKGGRGVAPSLPTLPARGPERRLDVVGFDPETAVIHESDTGLRARIIPAASGLRKAAEQGQAEGQMMPGNLYYFSLGADLDP
jgi:TPR repeat protein